MTNIAFLFALIIYSFILCCSYFFFYITKCNTSIFFFYYFSIYFILCTNTCAYLSCSYLCLSLSISLDFIWSTITSRPRSASSFFFISIYYSSLIFFNLYNSIILSFFFSWVLKSSQSFFFYSSCRSRIVAALAYATILFIYFTSSNCYCVISTARSFIAEFLCILSFSNSSIGNFFFFSSSSLNISSRFALANESLYYFSYSANLLSC